MKKLLILCVVLCLAFSSSLFAAGAREDVDEVSLGFAVSTLANPFFVTMAEAGEAKADEEGANMVTLDAQDSPERQADQVEDLIARNVDLLILNPVDSDAIAPSVLAANRADIPVITVTRESKEGDVVQHLDIDNTEAGELVAKQLIEDLQGEGKVAILEGIPGATSAVARQDGFLNAIEGTNIEVAASLTANYDRHEGYVVMEDILEANPDLDAVYAHNDEMALGAVRAIDASGMAGEVMVYGIDAVDDAIDAIKDGTMRATVEQQPGLQMEMAVESAMKYLAGETVSEEVIVPMRTVTEENL